MLKENQNKKYAFLVRDKKIAERFNELLSENLEIETIIEDYAFSGKIISVPKEKYIESLKKGMMIAKLNNWNIDWINAYGEPINKKYISVMYCSFPKNRSINYNVVDPSFYPVDLKEYIDKLQVFIERPIRLKYNSADNAIEFLFEADFNEYALLKEHCKSINYIMKDKTPFTNITYLNIDGSLIKSENKKEKKEESKLKSYFNESMVIDGLKYPEGSNIAPKINDEREFSTGYKYRTSKYGIKTFDVKTVSFSDLTETIESYFLLYDEKEYSYYWNNEKKEQTECEKMPFTMLDNIFITSKITVQDERTIALNTNLNLVRNMVGYNFDSKSIRDGLFPNLPNEDTRAYFEYKEFYKVISNGTKLLHYSLNSDLFEIYNLPLNWNITDGIANLDYPKIYDNLNYIDLEDIDEIESIISSHEKINSLIKKK